MKRKMLCAVLTICLAAGFTACAGQGESASSPAASPAAESAAPEAEASPAEEPSADPEPESGHYPVEITTYNYEGDEVVTVYEKAPERVLAVYQGCIETMIALGLEEHVAASYGLDNQVKEEWQAGFAKMNYDDTVFSPDRETVIMLDPDMIFSWGSYFGEKTLGDVYYWIESGTNPYINTNTRRGGHPRTLENEYTDLMNIGRIFDVEDKAQAIVDEMKAEVAKALEQTAGREPQSAAIIEFMSDDITNYGATSLGGDMVTQLGAELALPDASTIGGEDLIAADPDVLFVVYMADRGETEGEDVRRTMLDKILADPTYASLKSVQEGRVYAIMLGDMYASTVRAIDGIRTFSHGLYPELSGS